MLGVKCASVGLLAVVAALPWPLSVFFQRESDRMAEFRLLSAQTHFSMALELPKTLSNNWLFREAAARIEAVCPTVLANPALYCNLGNARYLAGDAGHAILAYRRGLSLDPSHRRLQENLEYVRGQINYPSPSLRPAPPSWPAWLPFPSVDLVLFIAFILYTWACISFTRGMALSRKRRTWILFALAAIFALGAWRLDRLTTRDADHPLVVIAAEDTPLYRGNGPSFPRHPEFPSLPRGQEARRLHQRGDWLQIALPNGAIGWVHKNQALVDE